MDLGGHNVTLEWLSYQGQLARYRYCTVHPCLQYTKPGKQSTKRNGTCCCAVEAQFGYAQFADRELCCLISCLIGVHVCCGCIFARYFIFLNSSVKGPFLPAWVPPEWHWTAAYLSAFQPEPSAAAGGGGADLRAGAFPGYSQVGRCRS